MQQVKAMCSEAKVKLFAVSKRASEVECRCPVSDGNGKATRVEMVLYNYYTIVLFSDAQSAQVLLLGLTLLKTSKLGPQYRARLELRVAAIHLSFSQTKPVAYTSIIMEEEDDDFYTQNGDAPVKNEQPTNQDDPNEQPDIDLDGEDDDDDDDDDDDSDIDIITEHKDGVAPEPP